MENEFKEFLHPSSYSRRNRYISIIYRSHIAVTFTDLPKYPHCMKIRLLEFRPCLHVKFESHKLCDYRIRMMQQILYIILRCSLRKITVHSRFTVLGLLCYISNLNKISVYVRKQISFCKNSLVMILLLYFILEKIITGLKKFPHFLFYFNVLFFT